jgi:hypothetical protein
MNFVVDHIHYTEESRCRMVKVSTQVGEKTLNISLIKNCEVNDVDESPTFSDLIEVWVNGSSRAFFEIASKRWYNYYGDQVEAPTEWKEEYFKLVDKMDALLNQTITF